MKCNILFRRRYHHEDQFTATAYLKGVSAPASATAPVAAEPATKHKDKKKAKKEKEEAKKEEGKGKSSKHRPALHLD